MAAHRVGSVVVVEQGRPACIATGRDIIRLLGEREPGVLRSPNIDNCCERLCHAQTVYVLGDLLGISASPGRLDYILGLDALLPAETNPAGNYPTMFTVQYKGVPARLEREGRLLKPCSEPGEPPRGDTHA